MRWAEAALVSRWTAIVQLVEHPLGVYSTLNEVFGHRAGKQRAVGVRVYPYFKRALEQP